jgi:hypothetical protein
VKIAKCIHEITCSLTEGLYIAATSEGVHFVNVLENGFRVLEKASETYLLGKTISSVCEYMPNKMLACSFDEHAIYCINRSTRDTIRFVSKEQFPS